jgi:hypothetical protein
MRSALYSYGGGPDWHCGQDGEDDEEEESDDDKKKEEEEDRGGGF